MARILRFSSAEGARMRHLLGIHISDDGRLSAALVAVRGLGLSAKAHIAAARSFGRVVAAVQPELVGANGGNMLNWEALPESRAALAEAIGKCAAGVLQDAERRGERPIAIGVLDAGWWKLSGLGGGLFIGACDGSRLAYSLGVPVIADFPAGDLAALGKGGPLTGLPYWLLLHDQRRERVVIDLGRTARLTYLPSARTENPAARILAFDVGPGTGLIDLLASRLTEGRQSFDPGGRLAVQGRRIPELLRHWLRNEYFDRPLPRWHPRGIRPERFLHEPLRWAIDRGWSVRDMLCTATHLVAASVALSVERFLPVASEQTEFLAIGGGQYNGLLLRELAERLRQPIVPLMQIFDAWSVLDAACAALLAYFRIEGLPAALPACSGAAAPTVVGEIYPGPNNSWKTLLQTWTDERHFLRAAS